LLALLTTHLSPCYDSDPEVVTDLKLIILNRNCNLDVPSIGFEAHNLQLGIEHPVHTRQHGLHLADPWFVGLVDDRWSASQYGVGRISGRWFNSLYLVLSFHPFLILRVLFFILSCCISTEILLVSVEGEE
jgi:hypothetical protein